jgi:hypothetical protein
MKQEPINERADTWNIGMTMLVGNPNVRTACETYTDFVHKRSRG